MHATKNRVRLVSPAAPDEWAAYHRIRRIVLFENRGRYGVYDSNHPDETKPGNYPKLLVSDDGYVGVVRIDIDEDLAHLRRVAIDEHWRGRGLGRELLALSESFARGHGVLRAVSAVAPDAVQFYEKCGYRRVGDDVGASITMVKDLIRAPVPR